MILSPQGEWIAGFVSGEGDLDVKIRTQLPNKIWSRVQLRFRISQHKRDLKLMELLIKILGSGSNYNYPKQQAVAIFIF